MTPDEMRVVRDEGRIEGAAIARSLIWTVRWFEDRNYTFRSGMAAATRHLSWEIRSHAFFGHKDFWFHYGTVTNRPI